MQSYYDQVWTRKLALPQYATLEKRWRSRWAFAMAEIGTGSRVLDAACGDGVFGEMLIRDKRCEVVGLDVSSVALQQARQRGLTTLPCDISEDVFPAADGAFTAVTLLCCLEHIFNPVHALHEAARVVELGGQVLVSLPNAVNWRYRWAFSRGRLHKELLHTNDGEGLHIQFFNYAYDFEQQIVSQVPALRLIKKMPALKNPYRYPCLTQRLLHWGMRVRPNLMAEYSHFVLERQL
jgi:SAM-dependent methyltransferase